MANARFIWDNKFFDEGSIAASDEDVNWPVTNLQLDDPGRAYKSGTISAPVAIDVDMSDLRVVDTLAVAHHNMTATATATIYAYSDQARTIEIYSETFNFYDSLFGYGEDTYGEHGFGGIPSQEDLDLFPRLTKAFYFAEQVTAKYWTIELNNGSNEFSIGRVFLTYRFEPENNFVRGHTFQLVDNSVVTLAYAGNKITDEKEKFYRVSLSFPYMGDGEAYSFFLKLVNRYGIRRPFVAHFVPEQGQADQPYTIMYGRFIESPVYTSSSVINRTKIPFTFEEEL